MYVSVYVWVEAGREEIVSLSVDVVSKVCVDIAKPPLSIVFVVLIVEVYASVVPEYAVSVYVDVDVWTPTVDVERRVLAWLFDQYASQELQHSSTLTFLGVPGEMPVVSGRSVNASVAAEVDDAVAVTRDVDELPMLLVSQLIGERVVLVAFPSPLPDAVFRTSSFAAWICGIPRPDAMKSPTPTPETRPEKVVARLATRTLFRIAASWWQ